MDHVNIISKEAITMIAPAISEVICIFGFLVLSFLVGCIIANSRMEDDGRKTLFKVVCLVSAICISLILVGGIIGSIFFRVPTGRYKYEATIDEENMTVAEYNEFMKAYNHSHCKNGIYYFEDWIE
jgi:hypothetical protein